MNLKYSISIHWECALFRLECISNHLVIFSIQLILISWWIFVGFWQPICGISIALMIYLKHTARVAEQPPNPDPDLNWLPAGQAGWASWLTVLAAPRLRGIGNDPAKATVGPNPTLRLLSLVAYLRLGCKMKSTLNALPQNCGWLVDAYAGWAGRCGRRSWPFPFNCG